MFKLIEEKTPKPEATYKRDWRGYSKEKVVEELSKYSWMTSYSSVQAMWNIIEHQLVKISDAVAPLAEFHANVCD